MKAKLFLTLLLILLVISCKQGDEKPAPESASEAKIVQPFDWKGANVYFLLTDRFLNGETSNDSIIKRDKPTATLRGFKGGDFAGVIQKIEEGYFDDLGVNAIWMTPVWEQIHGGVDEGTGYTYGFHGYWAKDWTTTDPSYGTPAEFQELVNKAHDHGIRVLMDVVLNHTGPVTDQDAAWPDEWVRTGPTCTYQDQASAVTCTLTDNLPDIKTESEKEVDLPPALVAKWKNEGRYDQEVDELDALFKKYRPGTHTY